MSRRIAVVALVIAAFLVAACGRDRRAVAEQQQRIAALLAERDVLRARLADAAQDNAWLAGMPNSSVRVGVPTSLARDITGRLIVGMTDLSTLELRNITVRKSGTIKKTITLGDYELVVTIDHVTAQLGADPPALTFGRNRVGVRVPARVKSGSGNATIHFTWDGRKLAGAVCGDADVTQVVTGTVRPARYEVSGVVTLTADPGQLRLKIAVPPTKIHVMVDPSAESLAAVRKVLEEKGGACGLVVSRFDVMGAVQSIVDKGFDVSLPVNRIPPIAVPIDIETSMVVRGQKVPFGLQMRDVAVTERMVWVGADVQIGRAAPVVPGKSAKSGKSRPISK